MDEKALDRDALGAGLSPYLMVGKSGTLRPGDGWADLKQRDRVLVVLLGVKAAHVLGVRDRDGASATEVTALTGASGGTVRPALRSLVSDRLVVQDKEGRYVVSAMSVPRALQVLGSTRGRVG